jgi:hypothetical protein
MISIEELDIFENEEQREWASLTPQERFIESCKLWEIYLSLGGSLDPECDSQSPFDFPELQRATTPNVESSVRFKKELEKWRRERRPK